MSKLAVLLIWASLLLLPCTRAGANRRTQADDELDAFLKSQQLNPRALGLAPCAPHVAQCVHDPIAVRWVVLRASLGAERFSLPPLPSTTGDDPSKTAKLKKAQASLIKQVRRRTFSKAALLVLVLI